MNGSQLICSTLKRLGVEYIFGLPGSQNVALYEALRRSSIRTILATSELAAAFMACGYFRSCGKAGVVVTIPGPGFTYALTGIGEAFLDSAAVLWIAGKSADTTEKRFRTQSIDQKSIARPLVKEVYSVDEIADLSLTIDEAYSAAGAGEPGPVLVEVSNSLLTQVAPLSLANIPVKAAVSSCPESVSMDRAAEIIKASRKAILYVGAGCIGAAARVCDLAERLGSPVLSTTSGRGIVPESNRLAFVSDSGSGGAELINQLIESCDLLIAMGCKFSQNGSHGFGLRVPANKLIHVDRSPEVLGVNYPADLQIAGDIKAFLDLLLQRDELFRSRASAWKDQELQTWRERIQKNHLQAGAEPKISGVNPPTPSAFFGILRKAMPQQSCLVTDSGEHQFLARKYFTVLAPRGLIVPSDFQSMGFGLPAAIGAKLARPEETVVVLMGDGGFAMSGMEVLTAIREGLQLLVIVFKDGHLGLIRLAQMGGGGHSFATQLQNPDFSMLARAVGANYFKLESHPEEILRNCLQMSGVTLLEVCLEDSAEMRKMQVIQKVKEGVKQILGPRHRAF